MKPYIGLMSGTSMDGIDAALVDVTHHRLIAGLTYPYPQDIKTLLSNLTNHQLINIAQFHHLHRMIGEAFAEAAHALLEKQCLTHEDVEAIGSHGQTVFHDPYAPTPYTVQLGCPHTIAERTGITVVADFRTRDMVLGGQGAPFAPLYHDVLFNQYDKPLAVVNIGGIANITFLFREKSCVGYDVGPGNCLMDAWIQQHQHQSYDKDGEWAAQGQVIDRLLADCISDPFMQQAAPKSIGKEYFSLSWLEAYLNSNDKPADVQATLCQLTALCIAQTIQLQNSLPKYLFICGGGVHNQTLQRAITALLPHVDVQSSAAVGISPDYLEAQLFAWLAHQTLQQQPVNLKSITGAQKAALLGAIYLP